MNNRSRILIVDDDPLGRETLGDMLVTQGYELAFAANGHEALSRIKEESGDLVLLDVMMPDMDGFEVCQRLKAEEHSRHIPVILVTALDTKSDLTRGLDSGADDFLHKPVHTSELRARVRSMLRIKNQYDELQEVLALREDMANMIVHDMRSPLTAIIGLSELALLEDIDLQAWQEDVEIIRSNAQRLNALIDDLLTMAKQKEGKLSLNRTLVDIHSQLQLLSNSHDVTAKLKDVDFQVYIEAEDPCQIYVDAPLFQRVIDNLVANAVKFSPTYGTVTLHVASLPFDNTAVTEDAHIRLRVIDEGSGISMADRERIFHKFTSLDAHGKDIAQYGLGLAFCKMVIDAHGGSISVEDNKPQGTIFTVEI